MKKIKWYKLELETKDFTENGFAFLKKALNKQKRNNIKELTLRKTVKHIKFVDKQNKVKILKEGDFVFLSSIGEIVFVRKFELDNFRFNI